MDVGGHGDSTFEQIASKVDGDCRKWALWVNVEYFERMYAEDSDKLQRPLL